VEGQNWEGRAALPAPMAPPWLLQQGDLTRFKDSSRNRGLYGVTFSLPPGL
jgi:hypothetical protein